MYILLISVALPYLKQELDIFSEFVAVKVMSEGN